MFIPTHLITPFNDPILNDRPRDGRPASRWEISQRANRYDRMFGPLHHIEEVEVQEPERKNEERFGGLRRMVAKALVRAGERLDPQLA